MKTNKNFQRLVEPGVTMHLIFLLVFAVATLICRMYYLAAAEGAVILLLLLYSYVIRRKRERQLSAYIESVTYETESAKGNTLMNFPLPIAVFRMDDCRIVWGNEMFFDMCSITGTRLDVTVAQLVPGFSSGWLLEGKSRCQELTEINGRKYRIYGSVIRSEKPDEDQTMGVSYWVDVTESENIRLEYESSRPVPGIVIIDNLDELVRNQPDRVKNDIKEHIDDKLRQWCEEYGGIFRSYDRDRYLVVFEKRHIEKMKQDKFRITQEMHQIESPTGVDASITIGFGEDAENLGEGLTFADKGAELALSRGGDQTVIKNRLSFEFYGGRGFEVEKRTKVRTRVMANTLAELVREAPGVLVMGHKYSDGDSVGAAVGICCLARKCGTRAHIVTDLNSNAARPMIERLRREPEYRDAFVSPGEAMQLAEGGTLLVVVDTNRPEQVEQPGLLTACARVAVIDHHRVAATYIQNAALGFVEPYASSASELVAEILHEVAEVEDILRCEAEAMLGGLVLDTKSFSIRTGERTFTAAAFLRCAGADTAEVKKLFQTDMDDTVARYKIMQEAKLYRSVAVAAPGEAQSRVVAAQAADELLNISGVEASVVAVPDGKGGAFVSARSIGDINVQILMEKLGGGGNRSAAAAQLKDIDTEETAQRVYAAIDEYLDK